MKRIHNPKPTPHKAGQYFFEFVCRLYCALLLAAPSSVLAEKRSETDYDIFKTDRVTIRSTRAPAGTGPGHPFWCTSFGTSPSLWNGADVVGGEAALESAFAPDLVTFINKHIVPLAKRDCPSYPITSTGVEKHFLIFDVHDANTGKRIEKISAIINSDGVATRAEWSWLEQRRARAKKYGPPCDGEPFCELSGGKYLNAIYHGREELLATFDKSMSTRPKTGNAVIDTLTKLGQQAAFLPNLAARYLHDYKNRPEQCFSGQAQLIVKKSTTDVLVEVDGAGNATGTTFGGDTTVARHLVNKRLESLCRRICNTMGRSQAEVWASNFQSKPAAEIIEGLDSIATKYDCNSPEMIQFENNLSKLVN